MNERQALITLLQKYQVYTQLYPVVDATLTEFGNRQNMERLSYLEYVSMLTSIFSRILPMLASTLRQYPVKVRIYRKPCTVGIFFPYRYEDVMFSYVRWFRVSGHTSWGVNKGKRPDSRLLMYGGDWSFTEGIETTLNHLKDFKLLTTAALINSGAH